MIKLSNRGISDALTEVIIIGVTLAVVIGAFSWITGIWGRESSSVTERVLILPDSVLILDYGNNKVKAELHIYSDIKPSVEIYKIELQSSKGIPIAVINVEQGGPVTITPEGTLIVPAGTKAWIEVEFPSLTPSDISQLIGGKAEVIAYTNTGYMYKAMLNIKHG